MRLPARRRLRRAPHTRSAARVGGCVVSVQMESGHTAPVQARANTAAVRSASVYQIDRNRLPRITGLPLGAGYCDWAKRLQTPAARSAFSNLQVRSAYETRFCDVTSVEAPPEWGRSIRGFFDQRPAKPFLADDKVRIAQNP